MKKSITFEEAKAQYVHRFTMEYIPQWALTKRDDGTYYAPQYRSDREWYDNTDFPPIGDKESHCESHGQTFPLGKALLSPYRVGEVYTSKYKTLTITEGGIGTFFPVVTEIAGERVVEDLTPNPIGFYHYPININDADAFDALVKVMISARVKKIKLLSVELDELLALQLTGKKDQKKKKIKI